MFTLGYFCLFRILSFFILEGHSTITMRDGHSRLHHCMSVVYVKQRIIKRLCSNRCSRFIITTTRTSRYLQTAGGSVYNIGDDMMIASTMSTTLANVGSLSEINWNNNNDNSNNNKFLWCINHALPPQRQLQNSDFIECDDSQRYQVLRWRN